MQYRFYTIDYQRMPGIMPSLETNYGLGFFGEKVNYLALSFVAPLSAYHYHRLRHLTTHFFDDPATGLLNQSSITMLILGTGVSTAKIDDHSLVILT